MSTAKTAKARLDADRTAKPKTRLLGHAKAGQCFGPGTVQADALENTETGERTPLVHSHLYKRLCPVCTPVPGPQHSQSQASLTDQLKELRSVANKLGLYDAADYLTTVITRAEERA